MALTRDRIVKAATQLFNAQGTSTVTTHDIAAAAGISPGNLYYHFKNKEEIIREIFCRIELYSVDDWLTNSAHNPRMGITDFMRFFMGNLRKYHFFFRDFAQILQNDPVLAKLWRQSHAGLFRVMRRTVTLWTEAGIMKAFESESAIDAFIDNSWTIMSFAAVYLDAKGSAHSSRRAEELLLEFLRPYHTPKGQKALELYAHA